MFGKRLTNLYTSPYEHVQYNDAGPTLNRYWEGRPTLCVPGTLYRFLS